MNIAFITVGDTQRRTGGYLYHAQVFAGLRAQGVHIDEIVPCGAALDAQLAAADGFGAAFEPQRYNVVVIDALARGVVAPFVEQWQALRPVVIMVHQLPSLAEAEPAQSANERALEAPLLHADTLIAVSAHGRDLLRMRGAPAQRIGVAAPGFDRLAQLKGEHPHASIPAPNPQPLHALCVAQWIPRKGITTLIQAWMLGRWPGAVLELIGETDADAAYAAQVRDLISHAPSGSVVVRGALSDAELDAAYRRADLFVLPSRFEGYGMVYVEALAHGLPVIATTIAPVQSIVSADAGVFVPPDDPAALAAAIEQLITDRALRTRLAAGAVRRAAVLPRWDDTVQQFRQAVERASRRRVS